MKKNGKSECPRASVRVPKATRDYIIDLNDLKAVHERKRMTSAVVV